jgi:hypothetical protein
MRDNTVASAGAITWGFRPSEAGLSNLSHNCVRHVPKPVPGWCGDFVEMAAHYAYALCGADYPRLNSLFTS